MVTHRQDIDGLRAIAVLAVVLHHAWADLLPGGYLGVDIFFVISGFVITASLAQRERAGLWPTLAAFYLRRIKRLLPALAVFVVLTAFAISLFDPRPRAALTTALAALVGLANLQLLAAGADYFGGAVRMNPFMHTWSLGVEEQFYLLFPALFWVLAAPARQRWRVPVLAALSVLSLAASIHYADADPDFAFYAMPTRFWELAAGALAFWGLQGRSGLADRRRDQVAAAALLGLLLVLVLLLPQRLQVTGTLLACALAVLVIAACRKGSRVHAILASRPLVFVGLISYSLYLWHWGLLAIARWTIGLHWWSVPIVLALSFLLATLSYRWVELPARHARWSRSRRLEFGFGLGAGAVAAALVFSLATTHEGRLYAGRRPALAKTGIETLIDPHSVAGTTWGGLPCLLADERQVGRRIDVHQCTLGNFERARRRLLVIGNSFAAAFAPGFDRLVTDDGYAVTIAPTWGASMVPELPNHTNLPAANAYYWSDVVPALLAKLRPGDEVLMINDLAYLSPPSPTGQAREELRLLHAGLARMAAALRERGIALAVMHGLPLMREANCDPAMATPQWFSPAGRPCHYLTREETERRRAPLDAVLSGLQAEGALKVVDLLDLFCPGPVCGFEAADGTLLYRDVHSHPSVEAARLAAPRIRRAVLEMKMAHGTSVAGVDEP